MLEWEDLHNSWSGVPIFATKDLLAKHSVKEWKGTEQVIKPMQMERNILLLRKKYIEMIENYSWSIRSRRALEAGRFHIQNAGCVNRCVAGRTPREYEESCRQMTRRLNKDSMTGMQGRKKTEKTKTKNTETISRRIKRVSWRIERKEKTGFNQSRDKYYEREKFNIRAKAQQQLIECEICKCQILCGRCLL